MHQVRNKNVPLIILLIYPQAQRFSPRSQSVFVPLLLKYCLAKTTHSRTGETNLVAYQALSVLEVYAYHFTKSPSPHLHFLVPEMGHDDTPGILVESLTHRNDRADDEGMVMSQDLIVRTFEAGI
jgi:hypothetical protein